MTSQNVPYWNFRLEHKETKGRVMEVERLGKDNYEIIYSFYSSERKKRIRTIISEKNILVGDSITVMYNADFPNYVEIRELGSSIVFYRTILSVLVPVLCIILILLGMRGRIDLNKLS